MQDKLRPYKIATAFLCTAAAGIVLVTWYKVPLVGNPWPAVVQFVILATFTELMAVGLNEYEGVSVSPTGPIFWAATCVLGPLPAIVISVTSAVVSMSVKCACFYLSRRWEERSDDHQESRLVKTIHRLARDIGATWQSRPLGVAILYVAWYLACVVADVGPAGLFYYYLGGRFLMDPGSDFRLVSNFGLPFVGLVAVSTAAHVAEYAIVTAAADPIQGAHGLYGVLLRMRLAVIETALPLVKGQIFLSVVALLLAYLYSQIGVLGFVLAITPVLALRDFFSQWVEERAAYLNTITTLATYMQHYHPYTRGHLKRVADLSERLARELRLPVESIRFMNAAGFLHDIGKIGVSEEILDKPAQLNDEEWAKIKEHPVKGAEIIGHLEFLEGIVDWIKYHHKWYNGSGYPATNGDGSEIPIEAAIIATADAFDAMTDDRELSLEWKCDSCGLQVEDGRRPVFCPRCGAEKRRRYREPKSLDEAIDELRRGAGTQFHPRVVKAFLAMVERDGIKLNA